VKDGKPTSDNRVSFRRSRRATTFIAQANAQMDKERAPDRYPRVLPLQERVRAESAGGSAVHGTWRPSQIVSGRGLAHPVPRARRRQPRADGLQHAAPGGALLAAGEAPWSVPALSAPRRWTRAPASSRCAAAWSTTVDANRIVVRVNDDETLAGDVGVDIYKLTKYTRLQPEHQHQPASDREAGRAHLQGRRGWRMVPPPTLGEPRASARNMMVAFMPWNGYNFEDSILILRARGRRGPLHPRFTSRSSPSSRRDTPSSGRKKSRATSRTSRKHRLARLDESGIVYIGAEVEAGDVLVGKGHAEGARPSSRRKRSCCARSSARRPPT